MLTMPKLGYGDGIDKARSLIVWLIFASSFIVIFEPAPCDIMAILAMTFFFMPGVNISPTVIPLFGFYSLLMIGYASSYFVNGADQLGGFFLLSSGYTLLASFFIACFISEDTVKRFELVKSGYLVGALIATLIALAAYMDTKGIGASLVKLGASPLLFYGRAAGAFKDPNVFSTYLIFAEMLLFQKILLGGSKRQYLNYIWFALIFLALFLAFSRGAWTNLLTACVLLILLTLLTTPSKAMRGRVFLYSFLAVVIFAVILMVLLSIPEINTIFVDRFQLVKKYDVGETGRFGNQMNAIPLLLGLPFGFGPYRFDSYFVNAPHNAFLNAFSAAGWLGGVTYFSMVCSNIYIGIRTIFMKTPFQNFAILVFACLVAVTLQGIQIDTEHWRHYYWMIGMMWGLFAASVIYQANENAIDDR